MKLQIIFVDNEFSNKSIFYKTRFSDPSTKDWRKMNSIYDCISYCKDKVKHCKAISFYIPTRNCQFFKNESLPQIFDPQFESFTSKTGIFFNFNSFMYII